MTDMTTYTDCFYNIIPFVVLGGTCLNDYAFIFLTRERDVCSHDYVARHQMCRLTDGNKLTAGVTAGYGISG